jgi:divalent metal cation (Fe/Co/Zn/Cd) transporter
VAGLYAGCVALLQRFFVAFTGNTSDAAAVISALILATVFTPIRKSIEGMVDRRFKPAPTSETASPEVWDDPRFEAAVERAVDAALQRKRSRPPA